MMYFLNFTKPPTNQSTAQTTKKGKKYIIQSSLKQILAAAARLNTNSHNNRLSTIV